MNNLIIGNTSQLSHYFHDEYKKINMEMNKIAITVLTKGYNYLGGYESLIKRNLLIKEKIIDNSNFDFDMVVFHEGNILIDHQQYICENSKQNIIFKDVKNSGNREAFDNNKNLINYELCPPNNSSSAYPLGYKHMCHFWSIDFLEYLKEYKYIVRIYEDCFINKFDNNIFNEMVEKEIHFVSPEFQGQDEWYVIVGLERLLNEFLIENDIQPHKLFSEIKCPYTNFMIVNLDFLRNNEIINKMLKKIDSSHGIYSNRWGDLPIWGMILSTLVDEKHYSECKSISYFHGSWQKHINL